MKRLCTKYRSAPPPLVAGKKDTPARAKALLKASIGVRSKRLINEARRAALEVQLGWSTASLFKYAHESVTPENQLLVASSRHMALPERTPFGRCARHVTASSVSTDRPGVVEVTVAIV